MRRYAAYATCRHRLPRYILASRVVRREGAYKAVFNRFACVAHVSARKSLQLRALRKPNRVVVRQCSTALQVYVPGRSMPVYEQEST